jgi:hypothetical protein
MKKLILLTALTFSIGAVAFACGEEGKKEGKACCKSKKACAGKDEKKECSKSTKSCCKSKKAEGQAVPASTTPAAH